MASLAFCAPVKKNAPGVRPARDDKKVRCRYPPRARISVVIVVVVMIVVDDHDVVMVVVPVMVVMYDDDRVRHGGHRREGYGRS